MPAHIRSTTRSWPGLLWPVANSTAAPACFAQHHASIAPLIAIHEHQALLQTGPGPSRKCLQHETEPHTKKWEAESAKRLGPDKILVSVNSTRVLLDSTRLVLTFFMTWAGNLARCFNKSARASSRAAYELKRAKAYQPTTINPEDDDADLEVYTYFIDI